MTPPPLDPVSVLAALITALAGPALAYYLGTYAVIILASSVGAGWSLSRREKEQKGHPTVFIILIGGTAIFVTTGIAEMARLYMGWSKSDWLLAPIALMIGAVGHDWPQLLRWLAKPIMKRIFPDSRQPNGDTQ
jgi:peptidoglycan/LPS O-acetylase OafA/YrhL